MKKCRVPDCVDNYYAKGLCSRHYQQMFKFGFIQERTKADLNDFEIIGNICAVFIYNGKSEKIAETIIDAEDWERCRPYKWYSLKNKRSGDLYIRSEKVGWLAPFIMGIKTNNKIVVDHINGNTLDNRKQNLQIITKQQNCLKRKSNRNNISGYRGVHWESKTNSWCSQIGFNGKRQYLGNFIDKEEAAEVYNIEAKKLFGRFAVLNKIEKELSILGFSGRY